MSSTKVYLIILLLAGLVCLLVASVQQSRHSTSALLYNKIKRRATKTFLTENWETSEQTTLAGMYNCSERLADKEFGLQLAASLPYCGGYRKGLDPITHKEVGCLLYDSAVRIPWLNATTYFKNKPDGARPYFSDSAETFFRWDSGAVPVGSPNIVHGDVTLDRCRRKLSRSLNSDFAIWYRGDSSCSLYSRSTFGPVTDTLESTLLFKSSRFDSAKLKNNWVATKGMDVTGADLSDVSGHGSYLPVKAATLACLNHPLCHAFVMDHDGNVFFKTSIDAAIPLETSTLYRPQGQAG